MPSGTIKMLDPHSGYGFIAADSGDVFFHRTMLEPDIFEQLCEGQPVEFLVDPGAYPLGIGSRAVRVTPTVVASLAPRRPR